MIKAFIKTYWPTPQICFTCGKDGDFSILLIGDEKRWYLPNQIAREADSSPLTEVWFCRSCMRKLENGFRRTLSELKTS